MDNENELNADEMETGSEHAGIEAQGATDVSTDPEVVVTEELASGESAEPDSAGPAEEAPAEPQEVSVADSTEVEEEVAEEPAPAPRKVKKPEVEVEEEALDPDEAPKDWYILKVAFNREETVRDALVKQIKISGLEGYFGEVLVPTEDIVEFTRAGKRKIVKRKLYPGYLMVFMHVNDDTWFLVRETSGVSDFTGTAGKPAPMDPAEVERVIKKPDEDEEETPMKTSIPFKVGDRVRVKEGNFQNQEGEVEKLDEANGRISVNINIFGRTVPVELDHWQVEPL